MSYSAIERGQPNTLSYRVYTKSDATGTIVSPFHDIPLKVGDNFNMVVEIPRWSNAKMEVSKEDKLNPIKQDTKKGKLRFVNNVFPHHGYIWNYGALPQTWEDPNVIEPTTKCIGDNDPLDVCEIGSVIQPRGAVIQVKVLGALGLIDEGEADWKIMAIDVKDPMACKLNNIDDIKEHLPGLLDATRDWFKIYKMPTGKPANNFAADGKFFDRAFALECIEHDHSSWKDLIMRDTYNTAGDKRKGISLDTVTLGESKATGVNLLNKEQADQIVEQNSEKFNATAAAVDTTTINTTHYIDRSRL